MLKLPTEHIEIMSKNKYDRVFFTDQLNVLENTYHRNEDRKTAVELSEMTLKTYEDLGYDVVRLPQVPVEERVKILLLSL